MGQKKRDTDEMPIQPRFDGDDSHETEIPPPAPSTRPVFRALAAMIGIVFTLFASWQIWKGPVNAALLRTAGSTLLCGLLFIAAGFTGNWLLAWHSSPPIRKPPRK